MVLVEISGNGNSLSDKDKEKIFDLFYTVDNQIVDNKRNLGLALCKSIILAHGGEIDVKDNKPHETVFSFTLPSEEVNLHE
ncbi:sensor histidine kinase [Terrisporobacter petrolearius]